MERRIQFKSRSINMKKMVSALLAYATENFETEKENITCFLVKNEFLSEYDTNRIIGYLIFLFKEKNFEKYELFLYAGYYLISTLNDFKQPLEFKDKLQKSKNRILIDFCKEILKYEELYKKLCGI